ncbi:hypothetical protein [Siphonobacter sp. BAB-5385]|uniref:hypothetical protein n=1 Tax=Siphonobacter sp. BAB-5385 TaxID=1864822 RepID=UPI0015952AEE|nr:hypothetical protein [Siphonobacter sp. BAB-5385]
MALLCIGAGIFFSYSFFSHYGLRKTTTGEQAFMIFGVVFIISFFYGAWSFWEQAPRIVLDTEKLIYNGTEVFYWKDLERLELTGKHHSKLLWATGEGVQMLFKGNVKRVFFDHMYQNSWLMKLFLEQIVLQQQERISLPRVTVLEYSTNKAAYYRGSVWRAMLFYMFLVINVSLALSLQNPVNREPSLMLGYVTIIFFFWRMAAHCLYYVGISETELVIRNRLWPGYQKVFLLEELREVAYEHKGKGLHAIKVIRKDFKTHSFIADGLSKREWLNLRDKLRAQGMRVRNELGIRRKREATV